MVSKKILFFCLILLGMGINIDSYAMNSAQAAKTVTRLAKKFFENEYVEGTLLSLKVNIPFLMIGNAFCDRNDIIKNNREIIKNNKADESCEQFVKDSLIQLNFPKEFVDKIQVSKDKRFVKSYGTNAIGIPFDAEKLHLAQFLANKPLANEARQDEYYRNKCLKHSSFNLGYTFEGPNRRNSFDNDYSLLAQNLGLNGYRPEVPIKIITEASRINAEHIDEKSLKQWQAILAHEAGHALRGSLWDYPIGYAIGLVSARYGIYKSAKLLNHVLNRNTYYNKLVSKIGPNFQDVILGLGQVPATVASHQFGKASKFLIDKYEEYYADNIALKHTSDPEGLIALAESYEADHKIRQHQLNKKNSIIATWFERYPILHELLDVHQHELARAKRFRKQAEELTKKN